MKFVFSPPSSDDLLRLLKAWRFWILASVVGALFGAAFYVVAPPVYRAHATVNVDFHMEEAWPQNTDREQFYYLERETRKLEEIAYSDRVLNSLTTQFQGLTIAQARSGKLTLSQPGNGGWHFYADDPDPQRAADLASAWAMAFAQTVGTQIVNPSSGLEQYITANPTQVRDLVPRRSLSMSIYLFAGAVIFLAVSTFCILFFDVKR